MTKSDLVDLEVIIRGETEKAWKIDTGDDKPIWLPKSQVEIERNANGRTATLTLPQWLAEERGLV